MYMYIYVLLTVKPMDFSYIEHNYLTLREQIAAHTPTGHAPVTLVCVTKSGSDEQLLALARAGACDIAENRPQELVRRAALLHEHGFSPRLHEIGNLQKNKVKSILPVASLIHSVGSLSLAEEIERQAVRHDMTVNVLMEVNSGREQAKGGVLPEQAEALFCRMRELSHLRVVGLMTMAPLSEDPEASRPYFRDTRRLFEHLGEVYGYACDTPVLSMGMSDSYLVAIQEGSTLVRVGRKLFIH